MLRPELANPDDEQDQVAEDIDQREVRAMHPEEEQGPERVDQKDDEERPTGPAVGPCGVGRTGHEDVERRPDWTEDPVRRIEGGLHEAGVPALDLRHRGGRAEPADGQAEGEEADETPRESRVAPCMPFAGQVLEAGFHAVIFSLRSRMARPGAESACHPPFCPSF